MAMSKEKATQIAELLKRYSDNRREQAVLIGYTMAMQLPINTTFEDPNIEVSVKQYFQAVPGEINEIFMVNLDLADEILHIVLDYRQGINAGSGYSDPANKFLEITGFAIGLKISESMVQQLATLITNETEEVRTAIESILDKQNR